MSETTDQTSSEVPGAATSNPRRAMLMGGLGLVAVSAGASFAWWRSHRASGGAQAVQPPEGFWSLQWDSPQGEPVRLQDFRGKPLLINFWATWCAPCMEEMPAIHAFLDKNRANGWQVLGLAVDKPAAVQAYMHKSPINYPVGIAASTSSDLWSQLGNAYGGLPFSLVLGSDGSILQRKLGKFSPSDLDALAQLK